MTRILKRVLAGLAACGGLVAAGEADAQTGRGAATAPAANGFVNPYMNPYMNPYLNPAMTVGPTNRNDAMLYLWAAQQQPGGLLGPRPAKATGATPVAEMPKSAMQPGGGASRFFNRGPTPTGGAKGLGKQYQRYNRYYSNNGR